jgi:glucuronoarabinoxylan endo-1,4-beta-xylanase
MAIFSLCMTAFIVQGASTITVTQTTHYQTMDGFGAFAYEGTGIGNPSFFHDSLGASLVRLRMNISDLQSTNNMTDSTNSDLTKFSVGAVSDKVTTINSLKGYGDVKFIASSWGPPAWMKDQTQYQLTGTTCTNPPGYCGGTLAPKYYVSFAGVISGFCQILKARTGVDIFAVSLQNEPWFIEPYESCKIPPAAYVAVLKAVGARLQKDGLPTRCFGAEDMTDAVNDGIRTYAPLINSDAVAKSYLYAFAVHGYVDGVHPIPSSTGSVYWTKAGAMAINTMNKKLWMSEMSGFSSSSWSAAMELGSNIFMALKYGQCSGWTYWRANDCGSEGLLCNSAQVFRSLVSTNYYRFIRPGAISVGCINAGDELFPVAFVHPTKKTLAIVILNQATSARQLTLTSGTPLPATFQKYTTTQTKKCVNEGSVPSSSTIAIDANSVTTLFGENYAVAVSHQEGIHRLPVTAGKTETRYFRIDGTSTGKKTTLNSGVYVRTVKGAGSRDMAPVRIVVD